MEEIYRKALTDLHVYLVYIYTKCRIEGQFYKFLQVVVVYFTIISQEVKQGLVPVANLQPYIPYCICLYLPKRWITVLSFQNKNNYLRTFNSLLYITWMFRI